MKEKLSLWYILKKSFGLFTSSRSGVSPIGANLGSGLFLIEAGLRSGAMLIKSGASNKSPGVYEW